MSVRERPLFLPWQTQVTSTAAELSSTLGPNLPVTPVTGDCADVGSWNTTTVLTRQWQHSGRLWWSYLMTGDHGIALRGLSTLCDPPMKAQRLLKPPAAFVKCLTRLLSDRVWILRLTILIIQPLAPSWLRSANALA